MHARYREPITAKPLPTIQTDLCSGRECLGI